MTVKIKNTELTPVGDIREQMLEMRPLPMGSAEFMEWSDRIIAGALVPAEVEAQRFCLADMLTHLGPTESHKPDAFFIHCLRKFAVNQVAIEMRKEIKDAHDKKKAEESPSTEASAVNAIQ